MTRGEYDTRAGDGAPDPTLAALERDDVDEAIDFLALRGEGRTREAGGEGSDRTTFDLSRYRARRIRDHLIALLDQLHAAIERRDVDRVEAVLAAAEVYRCIPAGVREEAIVMSQLPTTSLRAPMRLYRYQYLLRRLGDEPVDSALDPAQLVLDFGPAFGPISPTGGRELPFRDLRSGSR
jgi:hypothetical protein